MKQRKRQRTPGTTDRSVSRQLVSNWFVHGLSCSTTSRSKPWCRMKNNESPWNRCVMRLQAFGIPALRKSMTSISQQFINKSMTSSIGTLPTRERYQSHHNGKSSICP